MKYRTTVFISTAPSDQPKTGDVDYAQSIVNTLNKLREGGITAVHIKDRNLSSTDVVEQVISARQTNHTVVFHLIMNGDDTFKVTTGGTVKPQDLKRMKTAGVQIAITCLEYAKWSISQQPPVVANWDKYFSQADHVCFVDEVDKNSALKQSKVIPHYEASKRTRIIPVPTTIEKLKLDQLKPVEEREPNFLCFGIIRPYKGIEKFTLPLTRKLKEKGSHKKVIIVGSIPERPNPELLADMFKQAYGANQGINKQITEIMNEQSSTSKIKSAQLMELYHHTLINLQPYMNVEFHFNVEEENLATIFNRCRYGLNFNFKGVSPHFSSVTNTIIAQMKNYGLDLYMTPQYFRAGGEFSSFAKVFKVEGDYPEQGTVPPKVISDLADEIITDTAILESDRHWGKKFNLKLDQFNKKHPIDIKSTSLLFVQLYAHYVDSAVDAQ